MLNENEADYISVVTHLTTFHLTHLTFPANINLFKVNNGNFLKKGMNVFTVNNKNTRRRWRRSAVFIVNSEHVSHFFLPFLLLTLNK